MLDTVAHWLYDPNGLTPHGFCLLWEPGLLWTHALSDIAIAIAYFSIPAALVVVARSRKDLMFRPVFWLFAAFILLCGTEHILEVVTLWIPAYGWQGAVKVATAATSAVTAIVLWRLLPKALKLPSPSQLQEAHAALQASEARHRANFERSPVPVQTLDSQGVITAVSDSWLSLFGYRLSEVVGRKVSEFSLDDWFAADIGQLQGVGDLRDLERTFIRKDGAAVQTLVSARLERQGDTSWVVCVLTDISARRRAEEALRASEEQLRHAQKMEAVGQLTGGIAHDFNNMLQGISGGLDLMERRIAQGRATEAGRYVAMARQSVERASSLTHRMLAFARRQALLPSEIEPARLVRGMEELISRTVGPSVRLVLRLGGGDWRALCDENQLESALLNLAINARDAMPDGGQITITTADRCVEAGPFADSIDVSPGDYVEITVADTGTGMPPDVLARAFEPFFTTKPIGQGTGLGLSQLYGFVRQSGGAVQLESTLGQGTTVRLYLPRYHEETCAAPEPPPRRATVAMSAAGTVLLVEDEDGVRTLVADALTDIGCRVILAEDGPGGLAVVQSHHPLDLLVTDVGLPGLNGRQLADAARGLRPGLPVLLITGYAGTALEGMDLPPGMEVLVKPFKLDELTARVSTMLQRAMVA